ncbi:MAG: diaminobutyrate--2-oxoglutarate transaminase [Rhizobiaceae bacterium]
MLNVIEMPVPANTQPAISENAETVFERLESSVQTYARNFPKIFDKAVGVQMWDVDGNRYLDFLSGAGSLNYGHNHPVMKGALIDYLQADYIGNSLDLHTRAKAEFMCTFDELILRPRQLDYVLQFTGPTGTNAVEAAMKIARKVTGRSNIVAFTNGFHGVTSGALAATGNGGQRAGSGLPLSGVSRFPFDGYLGEDFDTTVILEKMLGDPSSGLDLPAAVLLETVQGEGGHNAASAEWLQTIESLCRQYGILLIVDEIQSGCGRTGTFFSFEPSGIRPDIVTLSKSISGMGLPLALTLLRKEIDIWKPGEHNGTFRGNNHAFITATAALKHFWTDNNFQLEIQRKSKLLEDRLICIQDRFRNDITDLPGRGMMRGLKFSDPDSAAQVTKLAFEDGLIAERVGPRDEVVKCMTPLNIEDHHLIEGLNILETAIVKALRAGHSGSHSTDGINENG